MEYVSVQGEDVPALGLGTYKLRGRECVRTVAEALNLGYRHVDTAEFYNNQSEVGQAISGSDVDREEVFLTTKIWRSNLRRDDARRSATESLRKLGLEYVDLLLIHWPNDAVPVRETIEGMNDLQDEGVVRHIGVSNFSVAQLREAIDVSETPIVADQVRYSPYNGQANLLEFCIENGIMLTAYSPLGKGRVSDDSTLADIGQRHGKTPSQVALRWLIQQEVVSAIPKASSTEHLRENIAVFDFELSGEEMERIFELQGGLLNRVRSMLGI